jgi:uncharacterized protein YcbK (DUF882 family)
MEIKFTNYNPEKEGVCSCGCGMQLHSDLLIACQSFIWILSRSYERPIRHILTSGARCKSKNDAVPGSSKYSMHIDGKAVDGIFQVYEKNAWRQISNDDIALLARKSSLFGGIGYLKYKLAGQNFIHLDIRPGKIVIW